MTLTFNRSSPDTSPQQGISRLEIASMALDALWSNKLRSSLTMLGVIIRAVAK